MNNNNYVGMYFTIGQQVVFYMRTQTYDKMFTSDIMAWVIYLLFIEYSTFYDEIYARESNVYWHLVLASS